MDKIMDRRQFISALGGAAAWPSIARAQAPAKLPEIGFLYAGTSTAGVPRIAAFLEGLASKGYVEGRNFTLVVRNAESKSDRFEPLANELVARNVRVLFASGPAVVRYARAATRTIPIVAMDLESDPVKDGLVASLARPGGNLTGLFFDFSQFSAKWLELLTEAVPGLSRLAVLWDPATGPLQLDEVAGQAKSRGLALQLLKVTAPAELDSAIASATNARRMGCSFFPRHFSGQTPRRWPISRSNTGCRR
jgi:ABC-type uncharacterized transport system substrate-binding protein